MCKDKPKFGGSGRKKQPCLMRKCSNHLKKLEPPERQIQKEKEVNQTSELFLPKDLCSYAALFTCTIDGVLPYGA